MLLTKDFLITIYNYIEVGGDYHSDLVDLLGTPDGSRKGYIGSIDRPLRWDWGETGVRKIINIIYCRARAHQTNRKGSGSAI